MITISGNNEKYFKRYQFNFSPRVEYRNEMLNGRRDITFKEFANHKKHQIPDGVLKITNYLCFLIDSFEIIELINHDLNYTTKQDVSELIISVSSDDKTKLLSKLDKLSSDDKFEYGKYITNYIDLGGAVKIVLTKTYESIIGINVEDSDIDGKY